MTARTELLHGAMEEALYHKTASEKERLDAYLDIFKAAIAEGFCPMDGYRLTPGRICHNPDFCGKDGGYTIWSLDGGASRGGWNY